MTGRRLGWHLDRLDGEINMRHISPWEWVGLGASLYVVCFALAANLLRSINDPKKTQTRSYTKRPLVGWAAMILAPATLAVVVLWSLWQIVVMVKCDITQFARLGNQDEEKASS